METYVHAHVTSHARADNGTDVDAHERTYITPDSVPDSASIAQAFYDTYVDTIVHAVGSSHVCT